MKSFRRHAFFVLLLACRLTLPNSLVQTSKFLKSQVIHTIWQRYVSSTSRAFPSRHMLLLLLLVCGLPLTLDAYLSFFRYSLSASGMIFLRKDKKTGSYHQINDLAARSKISHAIRYKRHSEEPSVDTTSVMGSGSENSRSLNIVSADSVSEDDAASNASIDAVSDSGTDSTSDSDTTTRTPTIDLFSDEELDSVLPVQFRVDPVTEIVPSSIASLAVLLDWPIPLVDESSLASDVEDFLLDSFQADLI